MPKRVIFNLERAKRQAGAKARVMEVEHSAKKLPPCAHCHKKKLWVSCEYVQEGIWWSDFLLICHCKACLKPTVIVYQSEAENVSTADFP